MPATKKPQPTAAGSPFDRLLGRPRRQRTLTFCDNEPLKEELEQAKLAAQYANGEEAKEAATALEEVRARLLADPSTVQVVVRSAAEKWDALLAAHPATAAQKKQAAEAGRDEPVYDPDSFAPALVAACAIGPEMSEAQAKELLDAWSEGDSADLVNACAQLTRGSNLVDLGA